MEMGVVVTPKGILECLTIFYIVMIMLHMLIYWTDEPQAKSIPLSV